MTTEVKTVLQVKTAFEEHFDAVAYDGESRIVTRDRVPGAVLLPCNPDGSLDSLKVRLHNDAVHEREGAVIRGALDRQRRGMT